jgi:hypothetical protein
MIVPNRHTLPYKILTLQARCTDGARRRDRTRTRYDKREDSADDRTLEIAVVRSVDSGVAPFRWTLGGLGIKPRLRPAFRS